MTQDTDIIYANSIGTFKNKQDFDRAYPLFVLAAKHNHADAAYRAGTCCENGWGCRRESAKALQFYRSLLLQNYILVLCIGSELPN
jgi:TPR repeat protein